MSTQGHPLDLLLREATGSPQASETEYLHGRRMLNAAIAAEAKRASGFARAGQWLPRLAAAGAAFVLVIAIGISISLLQPPPVTALGELANVAERVERTSAADGEYLYSRESGVSIHVRDGADLGEPELGLVAYLLPINEETWVANGTRFVSRATLQPVFFSAEAEAAYFAAGLDVSDGVGETREETTNQPVQIIDERDWPTTPGQLRQAMRSYVSNEGTAVATDVQLVELAATLLRETDASPDLRAATIRVLEDLDVEVTERGDGSGLSVGIEYTDGVAKMRVIEFDAESNLVREYERWLEGDPQLGVPAGTIVYDATFSPVRIVAEMPGS